MEGISCTKASEIENNGSPEGPGTAILAHGVNLLENEINRQKN